ncbi:hypothetical protein RM697_12660 [Ichthyenterobacterium sp. W332]|uniref:ATP synthase F0 sector subunit C n=1 Tax=Microcosmobacter mediterraneus TaxID=3075607 RepID=A0ABU2YMW6_9FLAO|nr:hypothetical protein [Ichthyenterobacterium sp. W332]MDT0559507.1 hypothetical protein [Ichthyenterobacterium sp. W332]
MKKRKTPSLFLMVIAIIIGSGIYREFDFEQLTFEKPALVVVYSIVFLACIIMMFLEPKTKE